MPFFSREELLGGMPAHRASLLLFAIESRTAHLVKAEHRETAIYLTLAMPPSREQELFAALAEARETEPVVTIQEIERYARRWQSLLPETLDSSLYAALAELIGKKYKFTRSQVPALRAVLQLDNPTVQQAFLQAYGQPLATIYAPRIRFAERARWAWCLLAGRLDSLPPFWLAFFLTMPGGAGLLALPVSLARAGLGGGILLLVLFGLVNAFTASALAEATARSGVTRLGLGWLGQLVQEYLGNTGSVFLTAILALNGFFVIVIFYLGVGGTLQDVTHLPSALWIVLTFGVGLSVLSRGSLNATIASTLLVVFMTVLLLLLIPLLALPFFQISNFSAAPLVSFDLTSIQAAFGLLLSTYFSHLLVATYGPIVIRRDASARSWIWGSAAAILGFMLIACLWLVVLDGVIPADLLARTTGTVISPLAERVGGIVSWLGSWLVILSLGLASVQISLGLFYMVQERLPAPNAASAFKNPRLRFLLSIIPLCGVFLLAEWFAFTGAASFANFLGILSAFLLPLLGGVLPVLLLASTRHRGDFVPGVVSRWRTHPLLLSLVYLFFVGIIFAYGLVIYQDLLLRVLMIAVGLITLAVTGVVLRRGALVPRVVIQIQDDQRGGGASGYAVVANGEPAPARVQLIYADGSETIEEPSHSLVSFGRLRAMMLHILVPAARECKLWAYRLTSDGAVQGLNAQVEVQDGPDCRDVELSERRAEMILPLNASTLDVKMEFK